MTTQHPPVKTLRLSSGHLFLLIPVYFTSPSKLEGRKKYIYITTAWRLVPVTSGAPADTRPSGRGFDPPTSWPSCGTCCPATSLHPPCCGTSPVARPPAAPWTWPPSFLCDHRCPTPTPSGDDATCGIQRRIDEKLCTTADGNLCPQKESSDMALRDIVWRWFNKLKKKLFCNKKYIHGQISLLLISKLLPVKSHFVAFSQSINHRHIDSLRNSQCVSTKLH